RRLEQEQQGQVGPGAVAPGDHRGPDRRGDPDGREQHHEEREAAHTDVVADGHARAEVRDPARVLDVLDASAGVEPDQGDRAQHGLGQGDHERQPFGRPPPERQQSDDQRPGERQEDQRGRHRVAFERKYTPRTAAPATSTVAYWRTMPVWASAVPRATRPTTYATRLIVPQITQRSKKR